MGAEVPENEHTRYRGTYGVDRSHQRVGRATRQGNLARTGRAARGRDKRSVGEADFDTLKRPTSIFRIGPPPSNRSILLKRQEAWDGEESEGGTIRGDSKGTRVRHRNYQGSG